MVIEPDELPEHAGKQKVLIGEDVSERLECGAGEVPRHRHPPAEVCLQK